MFWLLIEIVSNVDYRLARCCNPIMGDDIFGFVTIAEGIKIHRTNCPNAAQMLSRYGYRVVNATWSRNDGKNKLSSCHTRCWIRRSRHC